MHRINCATSFTNRSPSFITDADLTNEEDQSFNSRIKNHNGGTNNKLQQRLGSAEADTVQITNDYRSSKTCPTCHHPMKLHKYRIDEKLKMANGALRCINGNCLHHRKSTFGRDEAAGYNISIIGVSKAISSDNKPLPIFSPSKHRSFQVASHMKQYLT
ncbi:hypothetical protein BDB00DRAFT_868245 [Zychaea mexicana]|uniref:uncharacterized protein n=1 Tax=Zychaea mexicana TaxID=64656 RepID=UPI0022FE088C|nr:uncharacterized protein BDB00DRAFT_868245 [Zychaea mexicana]KAI9497646.1 hypothetical protein BDB00DRAFT_868245 [Zychaea mexicana]